MKTSWNKIKDIALIITFCGAIVSFLWDIREEKLTREMQQKELTEIKAALKELETFQTNQDKLNARESIVYNWALQKLYGTEIHEEDEETP
jgi:hypothetical protein